MADYTLSARITGDASGFMGMVNQAQSKMKGLSDQVGRIGKNISGFGNSIGSVGSTLTSNITTPAVAAAGALAGITLVKGFNRLVGIDSAQAKLKGLGHDAESVEIIMTSALDSVRGTSFGMDEAATTAASAVAAGIKPGKELTRYLGLTGDAAAIAGTSMGEMGSIINQVQTSQVAYTDNLNQLADRGIPIYQWLAEEAGVAASEVKDMASDGKISSEMFLAAIEKNIGGAAQTIGENSFTAAIANIGASMSRIGANFLDAGGQAGGFFSTVKPLLTDLNNSLGAVEGKAAELGVKFGQAFNDLITKAGELKARFDGLSPSLQGLIIKAVAIGTAILVGIGPALILIGKLTVGFGGLVSVIGFLLSPVGLVIVGILALAAVFATAVIRSEEFRNTVMNAFTLISGIIMSVVATLVPILQNMWAGAREGAESFASTIGSRLLTAFTTISSVVMTVAGVIGQFVMSIVTGFTGAGGSVMTLASIFLGFNPIVKLAMLALTQFGPQIAAGFMQIATLIIPLLTTLGTALGQLAAAVIPMVMTVISNLIPIVMMLASAILGIVSAVLPVLVNLFIQLVPVVMTLVSMVASLIGQLIPLVATIIGAVVPVLMMLVNVILNIVQAVAPALIAIIGAIIAILQAIIPVVVMVLSAIVNMAANIIAALTPIIAFVAGLITSIIAIIAPIVVFIAGIIAAIFNVITPIIAFVTGVFSTVFSIISGVFQSIVGFVGGAIQTVANTISQLSGTVSGVFNGIFATISAVMTRVSTRITGVFTAIQSAWTGLKAFVGEVFNGIGDNMEALVDRVKGFVNNVISGINSAVSLINKIPGVNIGKIPMLYRGTDDWQGGFARMNEGGRGELVNLPNGAQVIPHDVSMKYAREAGKASSGGSDGRTSIINEGDVNVHIAKFENHTDRDIESISHDLGWMTKRERGRLANG